MTDAESTRTSGACRAVRLLLLLLTIAGAHLLCLATLIAFAGPLLSSVHSVREYLPRLVSIENERSRLWAARLSFETVTIAGESPATSLSFVLANCCRQAARRRHARRPRVTTNRLPTPTPATMLMLTTTVIQLPSWYDATELGN